MKRSLHTGISYIFLGIFCIIIASIFEFKAEVFLSGLGVAGLVLGGSAVFKYIHWSKPENRDEYNERLRNEKIEMEDERKIMLRGKTGRIMNNAMLGVYLVLLMLFYLFSIMDWFLPFAMYSVIILSILLILQLVCGVIVFRYLSKRL